MAIAMASRTASAKMATAAASASAKDRVTAATRIAASVPANRSATAVLAGGIAGTAGIALAFAFASYIGFEATAIYGEESREPKKTVPRATYTAIILIGVVFAFVVVMALFLLPHQQSHLQLKQTLILLSR